jgi:hypothetical protein
MAFSFHCPSRKEAQIVEDIMRYDFSKIAVLNSYEYVDTTAIAAILGVEFQSSYDTYVGVTGIVQIHAASGAHGVVP